MNSTDVFVDHFIKTNYEDLPETAIHAAKVRLIDSLGVIMAGAYGLGCDMVADMMKQWGGNPEATVLNHGYKLPAPNAAMLNSLMMRSFDFEPVEAGDTQVADKTVPAHLSGTTVPVAITAAEIQKRSGAELLTALVLGDDFGARLAVSTGFDVYNCYDNTGTCNSLAGAAVAGKLYNLNAEQYKNAIGIALNCAGGTMQNVFEGNMCFKLPMANAARNSIMACELAKRGYNSLQDPVAGERTFYGMFAPGGNPELLIQQLGERYYADVIIKPYSSCRSTHSINDATLLAANGCRLTADEIISFEITVSPGTAGFVGREYAFGESLQPQGAFNFRFTSATALLRGSVRPEFFTPEMMNDPEIGRILEKQTVIADPDFPYKNGARVVIKTTDGKTLEGLQEIATGDPVRTPLTDDQVIRKYFENTRYSGIVSQEKAERLLDLLLHLEKAPSIAELIGY